MKATELRLGNLVLHNGRVVEITMARYIEDFNEGKIELLPIPLTEEWLVKFGFENLDFPNEFNINAFCVRRNSKDGIFRYITNDGNVRPIIKHVHQLQNLYFALTGEELTIK